MKRFIILFTVCLSFNALAKADIQKFDPTESEISSAKERFVNDETTVSCGGKVTWIHTIPSSVKSCAKKKAYKLCQTAGYAECRIVDTYTYFAGDPSCFFGCDTTGHYRVTIQGLIH